MKHIIDRNNIRLTYTSDFIEKGKPNYIDVLDWNVIETELEPDLNFFKNKWNGSEWVEGATPEEISQQQAEQQLIQARQFIATNKEVGKNFYDDIHLRITVALFAVERNILFPILQEVDTKLYPPLEKIKTGDFASALFIFTNQAPPTNEFVLNFYNEAIQYCQNYYDTKYPK